QPVSVRRRDFRADRRRVSGLRLAAGSARRPPHAQAGGIAAMGSRLPLFPEQASTIAPEVDHLLYFLLAVAVFFTLLIFGAIFYFAIRYRRRSDRELPHVIHGGMTLEVVWTVIPFGLTMIMFTWGAAIFFKESRPPDDALN